MRDQKWLEKLLEDIWEQYFPDVQKVNEVIIVFGIKAKRRLGSIKRDRDNRSIITVTGYYKDERVPEYVVIETVAHEMIHYTDGFNSDHPKNKRYPHRGSVIKREMMGRGLGELYEESKKWLDLNWSGIIKEEKRLKSRRKYSRRSKKRTFLIYLKRENLISRLFRW